MKILPSFESLTNDRRFSANDHRDTLIVAPISIIEFRKSYYLLLFELLDEFVEFNAALNASNNLLCQKIIKTLSNDAETILPYIWCSNIVSSLSCFRNFRLLSIKGVYLCLVSMYFRLGEGISWITDDSFISSSLVLTFLCSQISIWKL